MLERYSSLMRSRVTVIYARKDEQYAEETCDTLIQAVRNLTEQLGLAGEFPPIRAILAPDRTEYDRLVTHLLMVQIETPSDDRRIAQPQGTDLVVLSPSAYETHSAYRYDRNEYDRLLHHEVAHMFEEHLAPDIEAIPRWWSEGLAVYLSEQWKHEDDFRLPILRAIREGTIPRIREILMSVRLSYAWGWTMLAYVDRAYGRHALLRAVRKCVGGDMFGALGVDRSDFEKAWRAWFQKGGLS